MGIVTDGYTLRKGASNKWRRFNKRRNNVVSVDCRPIIDLILHWRVEKQRKQMNPEVMRRHEEFVRALDAMTK